MLPIFCRGQIGLKFVGTPTSRFLPPLTAFQLRSPPWWKGRLFTWVSLQLIPHWLRHARARQIVLVHFTLADESRQDVLRSSTVTEISTDKPRSCRRLLWIHHTSWQATIFCRPAKKMASVRRPLVGKIETCSLLFSLRSRRSPARPHWPRAWNRLMQNKLYGYGHLPYKRS